MGEERQKASDVWKGVQPFLGRKVPFAQAFPQIEEIMVEVEEEGRGVYEDMNKSTLNKGSVGEFVNCSNSLCYNGGFRLGSIIRDMVAAKQTDLETTAICQGYEGSPKGRRKYGYCGNRFKIRVRIKYLSGGAS